MNMNMKYCTTLYLPLLLLFFTFMGCQEAQQENQKKIVPPEFLCIPGKSVGKITPDMSEEDLKKLFGTEKVGTQRLDIGGGETVIGTVIFANTANQLNIYWKDTLTKTAIQRITLLGEGSDWTTDKGIKIGTPIEEVQKINNKPFKLYGFEWDYGGYVVDWQEGTLTYSKSTAHFLARFDYDETLISAHEDKLMDITGDTPFLSDNEAFKVLKVFVAEMIFIF
jgi:hypothetical protein